jgi:hypothetical protein
MFSYFKHEADASMPVHDVAKPQDHTAETCDISKRTVQRIISEGKSCLNTSGRVQFQSPGKHHKWKKTVTNFDNFNKDFLRHTVSDMYAAGEFPTAGKLVVKINEAVGFKGSARSVLCILKSIGFKYVRCDDGKKFLMEQSDIAATRTVFL